MIVVARTHRVGLDAARKALREWGSRVMPEQIKLLGLALVADGPRAPRDCTTLTSLRGMGPRLWHLPWQEVWRDLTPADEHPATLRTRRALHT